MTSLMGQAQRDNKWYGARVCVCVSFPAVMVLLWKWSQHSDEMMLQI